MKERKRKPIYTVTSPSNPNSCLVKLQQLQYRALVDSGAEISLISKKAFEGLRYSVPLERKRVSLQSVNGGKLNTLGSVDLEMKIGGLRLRQTFVVVSDLNRHVILGKDFLFGNGVRLYFDLRKMRIKNVYIPLENDIHIASIARLSKPVILKPQTVNLVRAQIKRRPYFHSNQSFQLEKLEKGRVSDEPEIGIEPACIRLSEDFTFPVLMSNTSKKFIRLKKGHVIGSLTEVTVVNSVGKGKVRSQVSDKEFVENIRVDSEHK